MAQRRSITRYLAMVAFGIGMTMVGLHAQGPAGSYTPQGLPTEITQVRFNWSPLMAGAETLDKPPLAE